MKRLSLSLFLVFSLLVPLHAQEGPEDPLSSGFTAPEAPFRPGMWWNPELDGSGMDIHLSGENLFLVWYTYETDGDPVWYLASGAFDGGDWSATLERYTWNRNAGNATAETVGEVDLAFEGAYSATFEWSLDGESGSYPIEPLLVAEGITRDDHTGHWFNPDEPGYGVTINDQGSVEFAVVYLYDQSGDPRWVFGQRTGELQQTLQLQSFEGACPACEYVEATPTAAGSLTRQFDSATGGTLTLDIDLAAPVTGSWQRQAVPIRLLSDRQDGRNHPAAMAKFASDEALEAFLEEGIRNRPPYVHGNIDFSPAPPGYSRTTVQVAGVDEADMVKTDGHRLFAVGYEEAAPAAKSHQFEAHLRILEMKESAPGVDEIARIPLEGSYFDKRGLYLVHDRDGDRPNLVVAQRSSGEVDIVYSEGVRATWATGATQFDLIDVSAPDAPESIGTWSIQGHMVATRRIGETLYVVTRYTPRLPNFNYNPQDEQDHAHNQEILEETTLADLLPDIQFGDDPPAEMLSAENTWLPPVYMERPLAELVVVNAFDLKNPSDPPKTLGIAGQTEALFASTEALYLASTRYNYGVGNGGVIQEYPNVMHTDIHKVRYAPAGPEYRGSASVEGHLGWREFYKPYRFGENDGVLGVVTSAFGTWGHLGENRLTLLRETPRTDEHRLLTEVAHLPNAQRPQRLGKPDEQLYATRFAGDRAYVLTAKQVQMQFIDPLYVVDLSEKSDPRIAGSLEVTGYSGFLYPINERWMVGVGEDAITDEDGTPLSSGLKIGLYDVSDPADPRQVATEVVGYAGSRSPVIDNPHAFSFLPRDTAEGQAARVALPIMETRPESGDTAEPGVEQPWFRSGLYLFNLKLDPAQPAIFPSGQVISARRGWNDWDDRFRWLDGRTSRGVITDANAYFLEEGSVWSAPWEASNQQVGPQ